jgi:hypothetical protein
MIDQDHVVAAAGRLDTAARIVVRNAIDGEVDAVEAGQRIWEAVGMTEPVRQTMYEAAVHLSGDPFLDPSALMLGALLALRAVQEAGAAEPPPSCDWDAEAGDLLGGGPK